MVVSKEFIESNYKIHRMVWDNNLEELREYLNSRDDNLKEELEVLDPRGRTPLMLSVILGHTDIVIALLEYDANATFVHKSGWSVVHEAVSASEPRMIKFILEQREKQKRRVRNDQLAELLKQLKESPDFYVEMKWEFTSWVPLVARACPESIHRVYKMGSNLRVDSTVDGPSGMRSNVSVIFQGQGDSVKMLEIDYDTEEVFSNVILSGHKSDRRSLPDTRYYEKMVSHRMGNPSVISVIDFENISFERNKTGFFGWGSDKSEKVNGYECKVFSANNFKLVTKIRTEHMSETDKAGSEAKSKLEKMLAALSVTTEVPETSSSAVAESKRKKEGKVITAERYFDKDDLEGDEIGITREIKSKVNKFKAKVWLCENYPIQLQEQIMPIVDIMALTNTHFSKLREFILLQIPSGFPVKLEVPFFHLMTASITFQNVLGMERSVTGVIPCSETQNGSFPKCKFDESLFKAPSGFHVQEAIFSGPMSSSDDDLFDWTTDECSSRRAYHPRHVDVYEALNHPRPTRRGNASPEDSDTEEQILQRVIEESLMTARLNPGSSLPPDLQPMGAGAGSQEHIPGSMQLGPGEEHDAYFEVDTQRALEMSNHLQQEEARRILEEEETLERVLQLSLTDK